MTPEKARNIRIGLFAIVAVTILCLGLNFLKDKGLFSHSSTLLVHFASVDGLTEGGPIIFNGFEVGKVSGIDYNQYSEDPGSAFEVELRIEKRLDIPTDSRAIIVSTGLLGDKGIELHLGTSSELATSGTVIEGGVKSGLIEELMPMKDKATALIGSAYTVMRDVDSLLDARNREQIARILYQLNVTMRNVELLTRNLALESDSQGSLHGTLDNANQFMAGLRANTPRIDTIMANATDITAQLRRAGVDHAVGQLDSMLLAINKMLRESGNIAKLTTDEKLYDNLVLVTDNLNRLLVDFRLNPSRYVNVAAIKLGGKQIYFSEPTTAVDVMTGTFWAISLCEEKEPQDVPTRIGGKRVLERNDGKHYSYLVSPFDTEQEARQFLADNRLTARWPRALVEHYVEGEKAR